MSDCAASVRARTRFELAVVALRLVQSLAARFGSSDAVQPALRFAVDFAAGFGVRADNESSWRDEVRAQRAQHPQHPVARVARVFEAEDHGALLADLMLLSTLPDLHEGFAALFRFMHPGALPYPTVALALQWMEFEAAVARPHAFEARDRVQDLLLHSSLDEIGLVRLEGDGPWHQRTLRAGPGVADALDARAPRLASTELVHGFKAVPGLESWLAQPDVRRAGRALRAGEPCMVALLGATDAMRTTRARALLGSAGLGAVRAGISADMARASRKQLAADAYCAAFMHGVCPWIDMAQDASDGVDAFFALPRSASHDLPALVSAPGELALPRFEGPILTLRVESLPATMRRQMWGALLPQLAASAGALAARYPIEPEEARAVVADLALMQRTADDPRLPFAIDEIGACLRARTAARGRPGVRRVIPHAQWSSLLVPDRAAAQLTEAVLRIHQQLTVLDDWGFAQGRSDRRGLRLLFYGPPGTGKTLAAEAMACALGVDLLAVDIATLVSKWIGETEKNLAAVFDAAETSRALLLFDEADALFGRRTEVDDANDRYANLETAFLLQRLERYEGVAILATNLRTNLDAAFTRRFEFIVEFPEPAFAARERLWRLHVPAAAPVDGDVDFGELAHWFAMSGAQIRNAALGAAFLAAAERTAEEPRLHHRHFLRAIEREYEKAGKAHPGDPPPLGSTQPLIEPDTADDAVTDAYPQ